MNWSKRPSGQVGPSCVCFVSLLVVCTPRQGSGQVPVFSTQEQSSSVKFMVKATVPLSGTFQTWNSSLTFPSPNVTTGALDISIDAKSVSTGSSLKDGKLKGRDFFNVTEDPKISFHSTRIVQTGSDTFEVQGTFTIRGISKPETLKLTVFGKGTGSGNISGIMAFDRKEYGMDASIPFVKIADRVEVLVNIVVKQTGGPRLVYSQ